MAKNNKTVDRIQAVWNKHGGEEGIDRLIDGETVICEVAELETLRAIRKRLGGVEAAEAFLRGNVTVTVVKHTVDLGASPRMPFDTAEVVKHECEGVVEIELRSDDNLYVDGKLVSLFLSEKQKRYSTIVGTELRVELENGEQTLLNSNVLDYIADHPELFPEHWKKDENGDTCYIYFWGSVFRRPSDGYLSVRYLFWSDGRLRRHYLWLGFDWLRQFPSAVLASSTQD